MEERSMPRQMDRKSGALDPCRLGCGEECKTFASATLHLHHVDDDVNGAGMSRVKGKRAARHPLGTAVLAVLLEGERVHRKDARVAGGGALPWRQHPSDAIAHHA